MNDYLGFGTGAFTPVIGVGGSIGGVDIGVQIGGNRPRPQIGNNGGGGLAQLLPILIIGGIAFYFLRK